MNGRYEYQMTYGDKSKLHFALCEIIDLLSFIYLFFFSKFNVRFYFTMAESVSQPIYTSVPRPFFRSLASFRIRLAFIIRCKFGASLKMDSALNLVKKFN